MSGYTDDAIGRSGTRPPDTRFLPKPFGASTLVREVRQSLEARG